MVHVKSSGQSLPPSAMCERMDHVMTPLQQSFTNMYIYNGLAYLVLKPAPKAQSRTKSGPKNMADFSAISFAK